MPPVRFLQLLCQYDTLSIRHLQLLMYISPVICARISDISLSKVCSNVFDIRAARRDMVSAASSNASLFTGMLLIQRLLLQFHLFCQIFQFHFFLLYLAFAADPRNLPAGPPEAEALFSDPSVAAAVLPERISADKHAVTADPGSFPSLPLHGL